MPTVGAARLRPPEALAARGKAGVANAQRAYALFEEELPNSDDLPEGANVQRCWVLRVLYAGRCPQRALHVCELAGPHTVNTMPEKTIDAVLSDGNLHGDTLSGAKAEADAVFAELEGLGIDFQDVFAVLDSRAASSRSMARSGLATRMPLIIR